MSESQFLTVSIAILLNTLISDRRLPLIANGANGLPKAIEEVRKTLTCSDQLIEEKCFCLYRGIASDSELI